MAEDKQSSGEPWLSQTKLDELLKAGIDEALNSGDGSYRP